jgi:hypothetical protein
MCKSPQEMNDFSFHDFSFRISHHFSTHHQQPEKQNAQKKCIFRFYKKTDRHDRYKNKFQGLKLGAKALRFFLVGCRLPVEQPDFRGSAGP